MRVDRRATVFSCFWRGVSMGGTVLES
jgi:hypothetical protein